jgi:hypothetical protein
MSEILKEKWLWIIILSLVLIALGSLLLVYLILILPFPLNTICFVGLLVLWGIFSGYKEWLRKEREKA